MYGSYERWAGVRIYRLLLLAYPGRFHADFGVQMEQHFRDRMREEQAQGLLGIVRVWLETVGDLMGSLRREWWAVLSPVGRRGSSSGDPRGGNRSPRKSGEFMGSILKDIRYSVRTFLARPGFTAVAVVTLALGIGANTAIFSVVNGILLRPLPYQDPSRLVTLWELSERGNTMHVAAANFMDWREQSRSFEGLAVHPSYAFGRPGTVLGGNEPVRAWVAGVSRDFFSIFEMQPALGRTFVSDEFETGAPATVVVSHRFWLGHLGGMPNLSGKTLQVGENTVEVVGVAAPGFHFPKETDLWVPASIGSNPYRTGHNWAVIGRLKQGVSLTQAQAEMHAIGVGLKAAFGEEIDAVSVKVTGLQDELVGPLRRPLQLLLGAAALVLLVACTNIASTLLAQGTARQRELSIRAAIGASRRRILRQLFTESLFLTSLGAMAGLALSAVIVRVLLAVAPASLVRLGDVGIDGRVALFAIGVAFASAAIFGLWPAYQASKGNIGEALRGGSRGNAGDQRRGAWAALVGTEIAFAIVLLIGSGLLMRSFWEVMSVNPGFEPRGVLTVALSLPGSQYSDDASIARFHRSFVSKVREVPGVAEVGVINHLPLTGVGINGQFEIEGRGDDLGYADYRVASGGYFGAMGVQLIRGRLFEERDDAGVSDVVVVNQALAERYWPGEDPVGKRIRNLANDAWIYGDRWLTVIGVVADVRHRGLTVDPSRELYVHYLQRPARAASAIATIRTVSDMSDAAGAVRSRLKVLEPDISAQFATMGVHVSRSVADRRFTMLVLGAFGGVVLVLAMVGIYGVVSYAVARRTREMGIRMALGAEPGKVRGLVQRNAMTSVVAGALVGVGGAFALTRVMTSLLFDVSPTDPLTFGGVVVFLLGAAWLASYLPARRSTRIDPMITMRAE